MIAVAAVAVAVHLYIMSGSKHWIFDSLHWNPCRPVTSDEEKMEQVHVCGKTIFN